MLIKFTKMQGLGNDFMVIDGIHQAFQLTPELIRQWSDRHYGVGFDQLLIVEAARFQNTDFYYRIFNADGSEVGQCGNGARCLAGFVRDHGLSNKDELCIATMTSQLLVQYQADGDIKVAMGIPCLEPKEIPFMADKRADYYDLTVANQTYTVCVLALGNPHCVLQVTDLKRAPVASLGALIAQHVCFPQSVNVGFMQIIDPTHIALRVFERGVGETLACGSGACAAVVAGRLLQLLAPSVSVTLPGGNLQIDCPDITQTIWMKGPAVKVFEGEIAI